MLCLYIALFSPLSVIDTTLYLMFPNSIFYALSLKSKPKSGVMNHLQYN